MKATLLMLLVAVFIFSCQDDTEATTDLTPADYSLEGKWRMQVTDSQMYIFQDGIRYTIYCNEEVCDWDAFTIADASPTNGAYTFENDTLIVNQSGPGVSFMGGRAIYKCDGNVLTIKRKGHHGSEFDEVIYRYGYNLEDCTE
jgi:hypothetical protein